MSACFDTFPFPDGWLDDPALEKAGRAYFQYRRDFMVANDEGLTKTYNRFHDPHEKSSEIAHLRELHEAMDRAVLEAYGWDDLAEIARCEFLLDYEEEDGDSSELSVVSSQSEGSSLTTNNQQLATRRSRKKKPWRLRWPDDFRDEVLARLLELNEQRHQEELLAGKAGSTASKDNKKPNAKNDPKNAPAVGQGKLFESEQ